MESFSPSSKSASVFLNLNEPSQEVATLVPYTMESLGPSCGGDNALQAKKDSLQNEPNVGMEIALSEESMVELEIERLYDQKNKGHISSEWELTLSDGVLCPSCFETYDGHNHPIVEGRCGHNICGDCYRDLKPKDDFNFASCPVSEHCTNGSFNTANPKVNRVAMNVITDLKRTKDVATNEMSLMHGKWDKHASHLETKYNVLSNHLNEVQRLYAEQNATSETKREKLRTEQESTLKDTLRMWKKAEQDRHEGVEARLNKEILDLKDIIQSYKEDSKEKKQNMSNLKDIVKHLEAGKQYYYLRCTVCHTYIQKMNRSVFAHPLPNACLRGVHPDLPRNDDPALSGWHEIDDFAPFADMTIWSQMQQSKAYNNMRQHLKQECIPKQNQQQEGQFKNDMKKFLVLIPAKEDSLPVFYRDTQSLSRPGEKRKAEKLHA